MKTVLITGASRGIGRSVAKTFAAAGYHVFAVAKSSQAALLSLQEEIGCTPILADVSDPDQVSSLYNTIHQHCDHIDVLVNNAGISYIGLLQDMTTQDWDQVINTNLRSAFLCSKLALPSMITRQSGCIINISSMWGERGASCEVAYSASKGGLNAFTKALAQEVAPSGIRVNAIACGAIDTDMNRFLSFEERSSLEEGIGLGRFGTPQEVADLVLYLAGNKSTYLTGQIITLDGCF